MAEWSDWSSGAAPAKKRKYSFGGLLDNFAHDIESTVRGIGPGIGAFLRGAKYDIAHPRGLAYDLGSVLLPPLAMYNIVTNKTRSHSLGRLLEGMADSYQYTYGPLVPFYGDPWQRSVKRIYNNPMGPVLDALSVVTMGGAGVARAGSAAAKSGRVAHAVRAAGDGADALSIMRSLNAVDRALISKAGLTPRVPGSLAAARKAGALPSDLLRGGDLFVPATRAYAVPRGPLAQELGERGLTHVLKDPNFAKELRKAGVSRALDTLPADLRVLGSNARRARMDSKIIDLERRKSTAKVDAIRVAAKRARPQEIDAAIAIHMDVSPSAMASVMGASGDARGGLQAKRWSDPKTLAMVEAPSPRTKRIVRAMASVDDGVFTRFVLENGLMTPEQIASNAMKPRRIYEEGASLTPRHPRDKAAYAHPSERVSSPRAERMAAAADEWVKARLAAVEALHKKADELDALGERSSKKSLRAQKSWEGRSADARQKAHARRVRDGFLTRELRETMALAYNRIRYGVDKPGPREYRRFGQKRETIQKMLSRAEKRYRIARLRDVRWVNRYLSDAEYKAHFLNKTLTRDELYRAVHGKASPYGKGGVPDAVHLQNIADNDFLTWNQREHMIEEVMTELRGIDDIDSLIALGVSEADAPGLLHHMNSKGGSGAQGGVFDMAGSPSDVLERLLYGLTDTGVSYRRGDWVRDAAEHYVRLMADPDRSDFQHFMSGLSGAEEKVLSELFDLETAQWAAAHGADEFAAYADEWFAAHGFTPEHVAGIRKRIELEHKQAALDDADWDVDVALGLVEAKAPKLAAKIRAKDDLTPAEKRRLKSLLSAADKHRIKSVEAAVSPYRRRAEELRRTADRLLAKTESNKRYQRMVAASQETMPAKLGRPELVSPDGHLYRDLDADLTAAEIRGDSTARYFPATAHQGKGRFGGRSSDSPVLRDPMKAQTVLKRNSGRNQVTGRAAFDLDAYERKAMQVIRFDSYKQAWDRMVERGIDPAEALDLLHTDDYVLLPVNPKPHLRRRIEENAAAQSSLSGVVDGLALSDDATTKQLLDRLRVEGAKILEEGGGEGAVLVPRSYAEAMLSPYSAPSRVAAALNKGMDVWRYFVLNLVPRWVVNDVIGSAFMVAVRHSGPALWTATFQYLKESKQHAGMKRWAALAKRDASRLERGLDSPSQHSIDGLLREHYGNIFGNSFIGTENANSWLTRVQRKKMGTALVRAATAYPDAITWMDRMLAGDVPRMIVAWKLLTKEAKAAAKLHPKEYGGLSLHERVAKLLDDPRYSAAKDRVNQRVLDDLIDYGSLSKFEREWLRGVVPFYSWLRGITVWSKDLMLDQPVRANALYNIGQQGIEENKQYGLTRPYMAGFFKIGDDKYINTAPLNPLATVGENIHTLRGMWNLKPTYGNNPIIHINPLLRGAVSASIPGGKDPFSGAPIINPFADPYKDRGYDGGAGTWPGRFAGTFVNGLPPVDLYWKLRHGTRPYSVYDMKGRDYLYNYLGFPVKKVDADVASAPVETRMVF